MKTRDGLTKTFASRQAFYCTNLSRVFLAVSLVVTCELWEFWWEWWEDMTWPTKRLWQWQIQDQLENPEERDLWGLTHLMGPMSTTHWVDMNRLTKRQKTITIIPSTSDFQTCEPLWTWCRFWQLRPNPAITFETATGYRTDSVRTCSTIIILGQILPINLLFHGMTWWL